LSANPVTTRLYPAGILNTLSRHEVERLTDASQGDLADLVRRCSLAVLNSGNESDDAEALLQQFKDFRIEVQQVNRGLRLELNNAPGSAFVDGQIIEGIRELISAVIRDLVYYDSEIHGNEHHDLTSSSGITNAVFEMLRNAQAMIPQIEPDLVVCWGGHSIGRSEYDYTKQVGYEFGLRGLDVCTGCGPGAMKGPMKGATIGHAKQRIRNGRYVGITEPGIIAAESPNPIVNSLVIMPDIEKRLEAFVRVGHGIVVFPGGVGTAEEILYLLGILLHPENKNQPMPLVMTGPPSSEPYFRQIDEFIGATLGKEAQARYSIIIGDPREVARKIRDSMSAVQDFRREHGDAFYFNWRLVIPVEYQMPFEATHQSMSELNIDESLPAHELAAVLRQLFSGIVSGNVREDTIEQIEKQGPFTINGSAKIMGLLDELLGSFVSQQRMKISGGDYQPCYRVA